MNIEQGTLNFEVEVNRLKIRNDHIALDILQEITSTECRMSKLRTFGEGSIIWFTAHHRPFTYILPFPAF